MVTFKKFIGKKILDENRTLLECDDGSKIIFDNKLFIIKYSDSSTDSYMDIDNVSSMEEGLIKLTSVLFEKRCILINFDWVSYNNIKYMTLPENKLDIKDKLTHIFEMQYQLNKRIGVDSTNFNEDDKVKWVLNFSRALSQETSELIDSVPWKWWAKYQKVDFQNAKVEVIDLMHFVVCLALTLGMSADDFYEAYCKKMKVNNDRQDSGYKIKNENDCKEI